MKIENFETKFSAEDVVYFMKDNELCKGIVEGVEVRIEESANLAWSDITQAIVKKVKSFLHLQKRIIHVYYKVLKVMDDGSYYCAYGGYFRDWDLAHTKEELFRMLDENSKKK